MLVEKTTFNPLDSLDERCFKTKRNNSNKKYINEEILILKCLASAFSILVLVGFFLWPKASMTVRKSDCIMNIWWLLSKMRWARILDHWVFIQGGTILINSHIQEFPINTSIATSRIFVIQNLRMRKTYISNTHICSELDDILLFPLHLSRFRYLNYRGLVSVLPEKKPEASERTLVSEGKFEGTEVSWRRNWWTSTGCSR